MEDVAQKCYPKLQFGRDIGIHASWSRKTKALWVRWMHNSELREALRVFERDAKCRSQRKGNQK